MTFTPKQVTCPCGAPMVLRKTTKYRYANGSPRLFYGCSRWPDCNEAHGAHPDGRPLGIPAKDAETKAARQRAHAAFDGLWKSGRMTRKEAYASLRKVMSLSRSKGHIAMFTAEQCYELVKRLSEIEGSLPRA